MVSKILKKPPAKNIKEKRTKRLKRTTPVKSNTSFSSIIAASINTCHRRLIKIFSKFSPKKQTFKIIAAAGDGNRFLLPQSNRRTIFLDLDETLIHSKPDLPNHKYDFIVRPVIDGIKMEFYVAKRPFVDEFLKTLSEKFELVIFTAGVEEYASLVIEMLDRKGAITHRLYRDSCRLIDGKYVKDLESFGRDLSRSVIVDDNLDSYCFQPENGIPIDPFTGDEVGDGELLRLIDFFNNRVDCYVDMRDAVKLHLKNRKR